MGLPAANRCTHMHMPCILLASPHSLDAERQIISAFGNTRKNTWPAVPVAPSRWIVHKHDRVPPCAHRPLCGTGSCHCAPSHPSNCAESSLLVRWRGPQRLVQRAKFCQLGHASNRTQEFLDGSGHKKAPLTHKCCPVRLSPFPTGAPA